MSWCFCFQCPTCDKSFYKKSDLHSHVKTHSGLKDYACAVCAKTFSHVSNLNRHKLTHTKQKPFVCQVVNLQSLIELVLNFQYVCTLPRKNMNLQSTLLHMYVLNEFLSGGRSTVHVEQNIFEKVLIEVGSSHIYASFGTFCFQIGQLFEAEWDFKLSEEFEIDVIFLRKHRFYRFHTFSKTHCWPILTEKVAKEA